MFVDPAIGDRINLDGKTYEFVEAPSAPGIIYAEVGRKAKVYRVMNGESPFALKAFKPKHRTAQIEVNTRQISRFQDAPGLAVAQRLVITPRMYRDLVRSNGALAYSIMMPWIEGHSWFNYITGKKALSQSASSRLAMSLTYAVRQLEKRQLAHCDLSSSNFIFSPDFSHVELIDIEDMFGGRLLPPQEMSKGTEGYAPRWIRTNGVWEAGGDRFAAGILISEILGWRFKDIREASAGDAFFADGEFGNKSQRFRLLSERLKKIHPELASLFKTVWYAESLEECPLLEDWERILAIGLRSETRAAEKGEYSEQRERHHNMPTLPILKVSGFEQSDKYWWGAIYAVIFLCGLVAIFGLVASLFR